MAFVETSPSIEEFKPRLKPEAEIFTIAGGNLGLYLDQSGSYLEVDKANESLLRALDGQKTLRELADQSTAQGEYLSIRRLLGLIGDLARGNWLANSKSEIDAVGLPSHIEDKTPVLQKIFIWRFQSRSLGKLVEQLLQPLSKVKIHTAFWIFIALAGIVMSIFKITYRTEISGNPLLFADRYSLAIFLKACGICFALSFRMIFRSLVLVTEGVGIFKAGLTSRFLIFAPSVDDQHIFRNGRKGKLKVLVASLAGIILASGILDLAILLADDPIWSHGLSLASFGSKVILFVMLCPFVKGDLGQLIDLPGPSGKGRLSSISYMKKRIMKRLGTFKSFKGELHLALSATAMILWLFLAFIGGAKVTETVLDNISRLPLQDIGVLESGVLWFFAGMVTIIMLIIVLSFLMIIISSIWSHLPKREAKPRKSGSKAEHIKNTLTSFPIFSELNQTAIESITQDAQMVVYEPKQDIVRQGHNGDTFFIISKGEAAVLEETDSGLENTIAVLGPSDGFGEMALLRKDGKRTKTVRALSELETVVLSKDNLFNALDRAGVSRSHLTELLRATHAFRQSSVFGDMYPSALIQVVSKCNRETYSQNDTIVNEGESGDTFYLLESGSARVTKKGTLEPIAELNSGDCFGELALLNNAKRNATVTCTSDCVVLSLNKKDFTATLTKDFNAAVSLENLADVRLT
jgi:CRP-like cAMP-binding protein